MIQTLLIRNKFNYEIIEHHEFTKDNIKEYLKKIKLKDDEIIDLRGANLICADLCDANLTGAILICADLRDADLKGANLENATLMCANLTGAILTDADLTNAVLDCANLTDTILSNIIQ